jgi:protein-L-isoaspartate(D-aspartate) O-methyltransferase
MADFAHLRDAMVERQIAARGIDEPHLLNAMLAVPREAFVPDPLRASAYEDSPLPIEAGQTISQPYIVALMIEAAEVSEGDRVLEIGAGSGYAAAVLAQIAARVFAIERHEVLARLAEERMRRLGCDNVVIRHGDGGQGWLEEAPFDAILVAASGSHIPEVLKTQLAIRGNLVMPVGAADGMQSLVKVTRTAANAYRQIDLGQVRFVPLVGAESPGRAIPR